GNISDSAAVTLVATTNLAPQVAITTPSTGRIIMLGSTTTLSAEASDADGAVASVAFSVNGVGLGATDTAAPYGVDWTPTTAGVHRLSALATDNSGFTGSSAEVIVAVVDPA